jgi:hypothetical protein
VSTVISWILTSYELVGRSCACGVVTQNTGICNFASYLAHVTLVTT